MGSRLAVPIPMAVALAVALGMQSIHASAQDGPAGGARPAAPTTSPTALAEAQACYAGQIDRCTVAGDAYHEGEGVAVSFEMAAQLYRYGCQRGDLRACRAFGWVSQQGHGVVESVAEARRHYEMACEGGFALGCYDIGTLYWTGEGVTQSWPTGRQYYERACDMGHAEACREVAYIHGRAMGTERDLGRMATLLRRACELGSTTACEESSDPVSAIARAEQDGGASDAELATLTVARGMPEGAFGTILGRFRADPRTAHQLGLARGLATGGANLTCAQIATLMQTAPIDSTRLQLATTLWPRAVDPQNFPLLMLALEHEGSRTLLRQQTGH